MEGRLRGRAFVSRMAVRYGIREMRHLYGNSPVQHTQKLDKKMPVRLS
jgi:hypothetical protein